MKTTIVAALLIASVLFPGCLNFGGYRGPCPEPAPSDHLQRFDGEELKILDQGAFTSFPSIKTAFENLTGAKLVLIDGGDAGSALRTASLSAGNPPADILYGVDNALFFTHDVRATCLFVPYESPNLARLNRTIDLDDFRVEGRVWATPVDHGYVSVNYDARLPQQASASELPKTLRDLASSRWAPTFVTEDPRTSSPGLLFLLATIDTFGEDGAYTWQDYWHELLDHGALLAKDWTEAYVYHYTGGYGQYEESTFVGDRKIVVSYTTSPAVEVFFGATEPPGVSLEPDGGVFHQVETMGILRGSDHVDLASAFLDFALTQGFQNHTAPDMAAYPVIDGVDLPAAFEEHATAPGDLRPATLTSEEIGANLDRWLDEWVKIYQAEHA